ncbi:MAG: NAD-dependent succinate-semialdehyde dehydrogenase [Rhodospirillales bacterium]|nr:NAD-dependent succinate-semialdehyde dehydrogenase [Rhodospirillales bacterium]
MRLSDSRLFRDKAYIDGAWTDADSRATFAVANPATGARLGQVPKMGRAEAKRAIAAAAKAMPAWAKRTAKDRAGILRKWNDLILEHKEDLARLMTAEQGKPLAEAKGEVVYGASFVEWFAEEGKRIYGDTIPAHAPDKRLLVLKQPVGVVAAITPWNFPNAMITRKCAPALAAGCTVVIKPAEDTPYSALALAELADRAGFPKGTINVLTGVAEEIGAEMTSNPTVRKISFTGSTEVGKLLMRQSAGTVKKISLELGGNAPFIVFDDADMELAVAGALASKYRNTGQTCVCANRILIQESVYDEFVSRLAQTVSGMKVGDGLEGETQQGPLINADALAKVERLVEDAKKKGARAAVGGKRHALGGTFYEPTVLTDVTPAMDIFNEEIFGPVAALYRFKTEDEAIGLANDTPYGLAAYFYSRDLNRMWRVSEGLEYGLVGVNDGVIATDAAPFGGVKESGFGREGSKYGIQDFVDIKYVCVGSIYR